MRTSVLCIILSAMLVSAATAEEIKIKTAGGTEKAEAVWEGESCYFCLSPLDEILGGRISWRRPGYCVEFTLDTSRFLFTVGSPYVNLNGAVHNLILPVKIVKGALFVPAETFTPLLNLIRNENITWDGESRTLRIDTEWFNITDLAVQQKQNGLLIEIFVTAPLQFEIYQSEGNWLNLDFPEGRINREKILSGIGRENVRKVNAFQFEKSAQVSLQLKRAFKKYYHNFKSNPERLQIAVEDEGFVADSLAAGPSRIGPDEKIDIVVIDPGHGGEDFGAIGRVRKVREKEITLEIARELARLIREDKLLKVVMTRSRDEYVSLDQRAKIANEARADLFVSIHCNSSPKASPNGSQVFYLAPAKSDAARAVAQFENAPFLLENAAVDTSGENDLAFILNDMIQTEFITESADLAQMTDLEMRRRLGIESRGVDHAAFVVLNRVYMPSILVEAAFVSNEEEEKLLRSKKFRHKVAETIYEAIKRFKTKYENQ